MLTRFGRNGDLSSFKESIDVLNYFRNKKLFINDKSEALQNTGMSIRQLNNEYRNLGITFTTVLEKATRLDTVRTELSGISPDMQKPTSFGAQIAAMQNDNTAATVAKRKTLEEEFAQAERFGGNHINFE